MRISDWSSDVCSSYLSRAEGEARVGGVTACEAVGESGNTECAGVRSHVDAVGQERHRTGPQDRDDLDAHHGGRAGHHPRTEENTSELQSRMRIAYSDVCSKKNQSPVTQFTQTSTN